MVNVALILQDNFADKSWELTPIANYIGKFVIRFEEYIYKIYEEKWDDIPNKIHHLTTWNNILKNLKKICKENES